MILWGGEFHLPHSEELLCSWTGGIGPGVNLGIVSAMQEVRTSGLPLKRKGHMAALLCDICGQNDPDFNSTQVSIT
jgi:hypothetical protein